MTKTPNLLLWLMLAGFLAIAACQTERDPCLTPQNTLVHAGVYRRSADTGTAVQDSAFAKPGDHCADKLYDLQFFSVRCHPE